VDNQLPHSFLPHSRIAIVGSGAVGLFYGIKLATGGLDIRFLLRSDLEAARKHGIRLLSAEGDLHYHGRSFYGSSEEIGEVDLVLISIKTTGNQALREILPPLLGKETWLLTLQNGLGNEEFLSATFNTDRVLGGLCYVGVNRIEPGVIRHLGYGTITLGDTARAVRPVVREIAADFERCTIPCQFSKDLNSARWEKLVWNISFNGLAIAAGSLPVSEIVASPELRRKAEQIMSETLMAANTNGCQLSTDLIEKLMQIAKNLGGYRPSSLIDFDLGREIELDAIWGEPLRRGENKGVSLPSMRWLYETIRDKIAARDKKGVDIEH
jgi:2-dehydropantoate 2-reductase